MQVLNPRYYLLKKLAGFFLAQPLVLDNIVKKLTARNVLSDKIQLPGSLNDFIKLNNIRVSRQFQNLDFSGNSFNVNIFHNLMFFENFDCYFFAGDVMSA